MNMLLLYNLNNNPTPFTPTKLLSPPAPPMNLEHYGMPMVHPVTGEMISSDKKLMKDPVTAETWQTAFGKDFGGMCQGNNKTGTVSTNDVCYDTRRRQKHAPRQIRNVCKHCCGFSTPKRGPKSHPNHGWRQPD